MISFLLRCKLKSKSPGAEELWPWTLKEKLEAAATRTATDLWFHTPVLPMSPPGDRWPSTSPPGWDRCLSTGTETSLGMLRTAPSPRTPCPRRGRSSTFPKRSIRLPRSPARTRNPRRWWKKRGKRSCDLRDIVYSDGKWKKHITNQSQDGLRGRRLRASTLPVCSPVN